MFFYIFICIVHAVLVGLSMCNESTYSDYYGADLNDEVNKGSRVFSHRSRGSGVCLPSRVCPWDKVLDDNSEQCMEKGDNLICCAVAKVRMPLNLFDNYE